MLLEKAAACAVLAYVTVKSALELKWLGSGIKADLQEAICRLTMAEGKNITFDCISNSNSIPTGSTSD